MKHSFLLYKNESSAILDCYFDAEHLPYAYDRPLEERGPWAAIFNVVDTIVLLLYRAVKAPTDAADARNEMSSVFNLEANYFHQFRAPTGVARQRHDWNMRRARINMILFLFQLR